MSQIQEAGQHKEINVIRSPEEIQRRMEQLQSWLDLHRWAPQVAMDNRPIHPEAYRVWSQYTAKLNELRWVTGDNISIRDGVE